MTLQFSPFLPWIAIAAIGLAALVLAGIGLWRGLRGAVIRALALALLVLALANPVVMQEDREALSTVVPVIVDRSQSQESGERTAETDAALEGLKERFSHYPRIEPRIVEAGDDGTSDTPSTRLFDALNSAIADVPRSRVGGAIFITDGQVHDIPAPSAFSSFDAPVHALITGRPDEFDRRIEVVSAPRFGIVGEQQELKFRVVDDGAGPGETARVTVRLNGNEIATETVEPGTDMPLDFTVPRGGNNILQFEVAPLEGELPSGPHGPFHVAPG
jgi:hypothetical protein